MCTRHAGAPRVNGLTRAAEHSVTAYLFHPMAGRTVTTPSGHVWRVRRVWAPRLGGESLWDRFRRRTRVSRRVASEAGDVPDPGCAADLLDDVIAIVVIVVVVLFVLLVAVPLLVAILDVVLLALLTVLGIGARIVFRRPWVVEARSLVPVPVDGRNGAARPSDTETTELRRDTWRIVGWRASGEMVAAVANALTHGNPLPPGGTMSPPPPPPPPPPSRPQDRIA
jgi:hypothetical protein